uniref:hypothetical protein n=1 Tax=Bacteroides fragilis TaxID=817 RepID=UPI00356247B2
MEEKDKQHLIEIVLKKGNVDNAMFMYSSTEKEKFLSRYDLKELADKIDQLDNDYMYSEDVTAMRNIEKNKKNAQMDMAERCKKILEENKVDVNKMFGEELTEEKEREEVLKQLSQYGITPELAAQLGLDDINALKTNGKECWFELDDNILNREALKKNEIEYTCSEGKLRINGRFEVKEGICYDDTPENRRILDQEEINYIKFAQGEKIGNDWKEKLFIPINWRNELFPVTNSQLVKNMEKLAIIGASSFILSPAGAVLLLLVLQRTGLYKQMLKQKELDKGERIAIEKGLTVFKQNGKNARYYYMDKGNVCSINARDVRIPSVVNGVRMSAAEMERVRRGEMVILKGKNGEEFGIRIDVTKRNGLQEYYREMRSDREMKSIPNPISPDKEKLDYIAKKGFKGIFDIYGQKNLNLERDAFLSKYGIKTVYADIKGMEEKMRNALPEQKTTLEIEIRKEDAKLKKKAASESIMLEKENKKGVGR